MLNQQKAKIVLCEILLILDAIVIKEWENRVLRFVPYAKGNQKSFIASNAKEQWVFGGNRSGKTYSITWKVCAHAMNRYPKWFKGFQYRRPVHIRIGCADIEKAIGATLAPAILRWIAPTFIQKIHHFPKMIPQKIVLKNGSTIEFFTYDTDPRKLEGWKGDIVVFDEPPPQAVFNACRRGIVDSGGFIYGAMSPLTEKWIHGSVVKSDSPDIKYWYFSIHDNPYLDDKAVEAFLSRITDPAEREAREFGHFVHLQGMIYKEFDRNAHVVPDKPIPRYSTVFMALDPHDKKPHYLTWIFFDAIDDAYVFGYMMHPGTLKEMAVDVHEWEKHHKIFPEVRFLDPNFGNTTNSSTRKTVKQELAEYGLFFTNGNDDIALGHDKIKTLLHYDKSQPLSAVNKPKLFFFESCAPVIKQMENYSWASNTIREVPDNEDKDFPDCLRYILTSPSARYYPPIVQRNEDEEEDAYAAYTTTHGHTTGY